MEIKLETTKQRIKFIETCAEYIPFVTGDCASLSPGANFFQQSAKGLMELSRLIPAHTETFKKAAEFYIRLGTKAPGPRGSLHPRGGQMFTKDELDSFDMVHSTLLDIMNELE